MEDIAPDNKRLQGDMRELREAVGIERVRRDVRPARRTDQ
jgi:hypothetical protein